MNKLYYKLGLMLGITGTAIGITGFLMRFLFLGDGKISTVIIYSLCVAAGILVIVVTILSRKDPAMRYYSKQYQTMLLFLTGSLVLVVSADLAGILLFILGLVLAYRYSFLATWTVPLTALYNCALIFIYAVLNEVNVVDIVHELVFIIFIYVVIYLIYADFTAQLRQRFRRLNEELDLARQVIPFGSELKKRIEEASGGTVDFTRKEYEVMVAMCFYGKTSNDELSDFMNISIATVKSHLNNIYCKTGIHSRSHLISVYQNMLIENVE